MVSFHPNKHNIHNYFATHENISDFNRLERVIVILYCYEGMTYKDIGISFDLKGSEVQSMLLDIESRCIS